MVGWGAGEKIDPQLFHDTDCLILVKNPELDV
jgi:hypothetical protein